MDSDIALGESTVASSLVGKFLHGSPSIYDGMAYTCILFLFVVVLTMHLRQVKNARRLKVLEDMLRKGYVDAT